MTPGGVNHDEGFSLVESVIACGVLAAGVLSVVQLFALAAAMSVTSRQMTSATILAAQKLEELRTASEPVSGRDRLDPTGAIVGEGDDRRRTAYGRRWTVADAGNDLMTVSVVVAPYRRGAPDGDDPPAGLDLVHLATLRGRGRP